MEEDQKLFGQENFTPDPGIDDILRRLQKIASCFRNAFPEIRFLINDTNNSTDDFDGSSLAEEDGDSIFHTIIIVIVFCFVVLVLVTRSSRGGPWASCKRDKSTGQNTALQHEPRERENSRNHGKYQIVSLGISRTLPAPKGPGSEHTDTDR